MSTLPPTPIPGTEQLSELRPEPAAFSPCIDLIADGQVLATLFYDDKPECAYTSVELENEDGESETVPGAQAGLDETEVGWCLQFTDEPREVKVISRVPAHWERLVVATAWVILAARVEELGVWEPDPDFRLWSEIETDEIDYEASDRCG